MNLRAALVILLLLLLLSAGRSKVAAQTESGVTQPVGTTPARIAPTFADVCYGSAL